jgi:hypothetical protein
VISSCLLGSSLLYSFFSVSFDSQAVIGRRKAPLRLVVLLSARELGTISRQLHEKDFTFVMSGLKYQRSVFFAEFLSLYISQMRASDTTIQSFFFKKKAMASFLKIFIT